VCIHLAHPSIIAFCYLLVLHSCGFAEKSAILSEAIMCSATEVHGPSSRKSVAPAMKRSFDAVSSAW